MHVARRDFLRKAAGAAGSAAIAGLSLALLHTWLRKNRLYRRALSGKGVRLIRPPGSVDERLFLGACIRCYRCQDACDIGAVQFFAQGDGHYYHTPYIDPSIRSCNLCMKCTRVCPTGALLPLERKDMAAVAMASVELLQENCLSYKAKGIRGEQSLLTAAGRSADELQAPGERRGPCGECYMFCPLRERAIRLEPGSFLAPVIFTEHCVGCGMCEEICRAVVAGEPAIRVVPTREWI